jgi:hypothetical protein
VEVGRGGGVANHTAHSALLGFRENEVIVQKETRRTP